MESSDTRLVLRDLPLFPWFFGLIFGGVGAFIYSQDTKAPAALLFAGIGLALLLFPSVLTITADRITRTMRLDYRSVVRRGLKEYSFDEIAGISVERVSGKGGSTYRVVLKRVDEQVIPLRSSSSSGSAAKERQAARLREFLGVPAFDSTPAGLTYAALKSYTGKTHETGGVRWQIQPVGSARWHSPDFRTPGAFLFVAQKAEGQATNGLMASLGGMFLRQIVSSRFRAEETPGLSEAASLAPLDPALESHFMAYSNSPDAARRILNPTAVSLLAEWAGRYPLRMLQKQSGYGQLTILFGPNGVYVAPMNPLKPDQVGELSALGTGLVRSQHGRRTDQASVS
jgi:hypothetical protein